MIVFYALRRKTENLENEKKGDEENEMEEE